MQGQFDALRESLLEPLVVVELVFLEIMKGLLGEVVEQEAGQVETIVGHLPGFEEWEEAIKQILPEIESFSGR